MLNRRRFLQAAGGAAAFAALRRCVYAFQQSPGIGKFNQALPGLGPTGIPVATPISAGLPVDTYQLQIQQFQQQILPPPYGKTTLWGYVDANPAIANNPRYLGPVIVAKKNRSVQLTVTNRLPNKHILPVDTTIMGADPGQDVNRISVHLHGGFNTWNYDGGPYAWFAPDGQTGTSFLNGTGVPGQAQYYYPNQQSARLMWHHDHAVGITRLNVYAGIVSAYLLGDDFEDTLIAAGAIPSTQIPLVIQDKSFNADGSLWYPTRYEYLNSLGASDSSDGEQLFRADRAVGKRERHATADLLRAGIFLRHDSCERRSLSGCQGSRSAGPFSNPKWIASEIL
jgi:spore coat protein A